MATNIRSETLRNIFERALARVPREHYIGKYDDAIRKRIAEDIQDYEKEMERLLKKLANLTNPGFWRENDTVVGNQHTGRVGKTRCGININKKDFSRGGRMYVLRYCDDDGVTYVVLVGYQLPHERDIPWMDEVEEIKSRFGGEIFADVEEYIDEIDHVKENSEIPEMHGGFLSSFDTLTQRKIDSLLHEGNMTITDDQFSKIRTTPPLLIDGHAGTGKSIIIALRIAFDIYFYDKDKKREIPKLLVIAYNRKVLNNIQKFTEYWIEQLIPGKLSEHYFDCVEYIPTLNVYHSLMKDVDRENTPEPQEVRFIAKYVSFFKFESNFFKQFYRNPSGISAEECWHFIRGIMKGQRFGWLGEDEITVDDFGSENADGKIHKKSTLHMSKEFIETNLEYYRKYEIWRTDNNLLDDIDLVRKAGEGIKKNPDHHMLGKYTNVLIDEAQDLTTEEYRLILNLLIKPTSAKLIVGGDPLQTINPTGFSWNVLESFITSIMGENKDIMSERMLVSHRMPKNLVDMANVIIGARNVFSDEANDMMESHTTNEITGLIQAVGYDENDSQHHANMQDFIADILAKDVGILLWARDKGELEVIGNKDKAISSLKENMGQDGANIIDIHSIESVKGLEYESVILYRFAALDDRFSNIETILDHSKSDENTLYHDLYFLNRLFIALTRSKKNIYIIDSEDNIKRFWNNVLWKSSIDAKVGFLTFIEDFDVEPSLNKSRQYFDTAKERHDIDLMQRALASAKKCEQSKERDQLIAEIEMHKTNLEIENARQEGNSKLVKELEAKLIEIYDKDGNVIKASYLRITSDLWDDLRINLKKPSKIPEIILIHKFLRVRFEYSKDDLEEIIKMKKWIIDDKEVKSKLRHLVKETSKELMTDLSAESIKLLLKTPYNFLPETIMLRLRNEWSVIDRTINQMKSKNLIKDMNANDKYVKKIKSIWADVDEVPSKKARIIYYNHLLSNPNAGATQTEICIAKLSELGDKNAVKKRIQNIFAQLDRFSIIDDVWVKMQTVLEEDAETDWSKHEEFRKRLKVVNSLHKWTTPSALDSALALCKEEKHKFYSGIEVLDDVTVKKITAGLYSINSDDISKMFGKIRDEFMTWKNMQTLITVKIDFIDKLSNVFSHANHETKMIAVLKETITKTIDHKWKYSSDNISRILEIIGATKKLEGNKNSFYLKIAIWLNKEGLLKLVRTNENIIPEEYTKFLPPEIKEKIEFLTQLRVVIDNGKPSEANYLTFLTLAQLHDYDDIANELIPFANVSETVKITNLIKLQNYSELKKYAIKEINDTLRDEIKQIKWSDVSWEKSGWACPRGKPTSISKGVEYPKEYDGKPLLKLLTAHTISDLFYEIFTSIFPEKITKEYTTKDIPEGFTTDFFAKIYTPIEETIQNKIEANYHWQNILTSILPEIKRPASKRLRLKVWNLICLSFIDALVVYEEITTQPDRIKFAKALGVKEIKTGIKVMELNKMILKSPLFQYIIEDDGEIEGSIKGILGLD